MLLCRENRKTRSTSNMNDKNAIRIAFNYNEKLGQLYIEPDTDVYSSSNSMLNAHKSCDLLT